MRRDRAEIGKAFLFAAILAGAVHVALFLVVTLARIGYRYELEWTEAGILVQVNHVMRGMPVFSAPSPEYVAYFYTPLYFWLGAIASVFGGGFLPLRLLSLLSILAAMGLGYRWIRSTTGSTYAGVLSTCLFAASFKLTGFWFDLARVDNLCLFFLILGLRIIYAAPTAWSGTLAALTFSLAFMTKQNSIAVTVAMLPLVLLKGFRHGRETKGTFQRKQFLIAFGAAIILGTGGWSIFLNWKSDGWFNYFVFMVPSGEPSVPGAWLRFWTQDLRLFFLPLGLAGFAVYRAFSHGGLFSEILWFRLCASAGMVGSAWITRTHVGSWNNVLMPAFAWLAIMAGWGVAELLPLSGRRGMFIGTLFLFQFASLLYNPWTQIPTAADSVEGAAIVDKIRSMQGDVWVLDHEYLAEWAGKKVFGNRMLLQGLRHGSGGNPHKLEEDSLLTLLKQKRFGAIVMDSPDWHDGLIFPSSMDSYYSLQDSFPLSGRAFYPKTGEKSRPRYVYLPK